MSGLLLCFTIFLAAARELLVPDEFDQRVHPAGFALCLQDKTGRTFGSSMLGFCSTSVRILLPSCLEVASSRSSRLLAH